MFFVTPLRTCWLAHDTSGCLNLVYSGAVLVFAPCLITLPTVAIFYSGAVLVFVPGLMEIENIITRMRVEAVNQKLVS